MRTYLVTTLVLAGLAVASFAFAQQQIPQGEPLTLDRIEELITSVISTGVRLASIFMVAYIVWAGISYMRAGGDNTKVEAAKQKIKYGVIGAAIILGVGLILNTIAGVISGSFFNGGGSSPPTQQQDPGIWI